LNNYHRGGIVDPRLKKNGFSRTKIFFTGVIAGIVISVLIGMAGVMYLIKNPKIILEKAADLGIKQAVVKTMRTVPREYIARKKDEILESANRFLQAYSQGTLSSKELNVLTQKIFESSADQEVTPEEMDDLLKIIDQFVH
jgi:hypothetical protein